MSCSEHPIVSIVVCTRGLRSSLLRCLDSLLAQNCQYSEILLVLNSDYNEVFAQSVAPYRLRLLNEPRPGVCAARNSAIGLAKGEVLAFVDDDVVAHAHWLHELLKGFDDPRVACVTGRVVPEGPSYFADDHYGERAVSAWTLDSSDQEWFRTAIGRYVGSGCNMAFRKSFLEKYALFPEDLGAGSVIGVGDEPYMFLHVLKHGFRIYHTPFAAVTHFFESDPHRRKTRVSQIYTASVAFKLKLLADEKDYRLRTVMYMVSGFGRVFWALARESFASKPQGLLSISERILARLRGPLVFWKSRRS